MKRIIKYILEIYLLKKKPLNYVKRIGVQIGDNCRVYGLERSTFGSEPYLIKIGNRVTIAAGVNFITHNGGLWVFREEYPDIDSFGPITVGNNVFIGMNTLIMPGVTIGDDVIIGAGSIVTKSIESNSIVAGVPAKLIDKVSNYKMKIFENVMYTKQKSSKDKKEILLKKYKSE